MPVRLSLFSARSSTRDADSKETTKEAKRLSRTSKSKPPPAFLNSSLSRTTASATSSATSLSREPSSSKDSLFRTSNSGSKRTSVPSTPSEEKYGKPESFRHSFTGFFSGGSKRNSSVSVNAVKDSSQSLADAFPPLSPVEVEFKADAAEAISAVPRKEASKTNGKRPTSAVHPKTDTGETTIPTVARSTSVRSKRRSFFGPRKSVDIERKESAKSTQAREAKDVREQAQSEAVSTPRQPEIKNNNAPLPRQPHSTSSSTLIPSPTPTATSKSPYGGKDKIPKDVKIPIPKPGQQGPAFLFSGSSTGSSSTGSSSGSTKADDDPFADFKQAVQAFREGDILLPKKPIDQVKNPRRKSPPDRDRVKRRRSPPPVSFYNRGRLDVDSFQQRSKPGPSNLRRSTSVDDVENYEGETATESTESTPMTEIEEPEFHAITTEGKVCLHERQPKKTLALADTSSGGENEVVAQPALTSTLQPVELDGSAPISPSKPFNSRMSQVDGIENDQFVGGWKLKKVLAASAAERSKLAQEPEIGTASEITVGLEVAPSRPRPTLHTKTVSEPVIENSGVISINSVEVVRQPKSTSLVSGSTDSVLPASVSEKVEASKSRTEENEPVPEKRTRKLLVKRDRRASKGEKDVKGKSETAKGKEKAVDVPVEQEVELLTPSSLAAMSEAVSQGSGSSSHSSVLQMVPPTGNASSIVPQTPVSLPLKHATLVEPQPPISIEHLPIAGPSKATSLPVRPGPSPIISPSSSNGHGGRSVPTYRREKTSESSPLRNEVTANSPPPPESPNASSRFPLPATIPTAAGSSTTVASSESQSSSVPFTPPKPLAKVFVICCRCNFWHDLPSAWYMDMVKNGSVTKCPYCIHPMSTKCCAGYTCVVYLHQRHH